MPETLTRREVRAPSEPSYSLSEQLGTGAVVLGLGLVISHNLEVAAGAGIAGFTAIAIGEVIDRVRQRRASSR